MLNRILTSLFGSRNERLIVDYEIRPETRRITGHFVRFPRRW